MDTDFVSGIDYTNIEGIQRKRVLKFVNHFIVQTTNFLSNFAQTCDIKLLTLANKLQNLETSLVLLENKLDSIPQLKNEVKIPQNIPEPKISENVEVSKLVEEKLEFEETEKSEKEPKKEIIDPKIKAFEKMLNVGVPEQAVRLKMRSQGLDDSLLDSLILTKKM